MSEWERRIDPNSQREFWINHATRETSWNAPPNGTPLPSGWEEKRDAQGRVFFIDHSTKKTTWADPRGTAASSSSSSSSSSSTAAKQQMSDEEMARMLQAEEEVVTAPSPPQTKSKSVLPSFFGGSKPKAVTSPIVAQPTAEDDDDEALARQLQEEWLVEDEPADVPPARVRSGSKAAEKSVDLPVSTFSSHIQMRHTIQQAGWRRVYARLHGKTFAIYPSETATKAEVEIDVSGAVLGELESKGGMMSRKNIFRFGLVSEQEAATRKETDKSRWAAESEEDRALWIAHLVLAGAERPEPGLLCRCFLPLLQGPQSETRANGLSVLADVTKQAMAAGDLGPISVAMHESGVLADVIRCLGETGGGQEHAARLIFYIGGNAECQAALHKAGAVTQLLDLLTTPNDQLQTWCVAALRPLVAGNASATASCVESDGIFVLTSLLLSASADIQGHSLAAICTLLTTCTRDDTVGLDPAIAVQMVQTITSALEGAGAYKAMLGAMKGGDSRVVGVATQLVDTLVSLQEPRVIVALRRGGAAAVLVGMIMRLQPLETEVRKAALSILARLTAGDPFDAAPTFREVSRDGGVEALLNLAAMRREDAEMREHACVVIEHLSGHPDFTDILMRSGALQKLNQVISDPNMNSTTSSTSEILSSGGREAPGQPASARAVGAYCNILCNTTRESDILIAIQSNGMDLVLALMASPHSNISTRAVQLLHAFACCKDDTVQSLVHAMAGRGSGMVNALIGRVMNHLSKHQQGGSPTEQEANAFTINLLALGSLCGAGCAPGAFPGHAEVCSEVCSHLDVIRRLVGVVQGLEPAVQTNGGDASAVSAATRMFEALCQNGSADCASQLANAGALGVVVGRMQQKKTGSTATSERLAALRTFETMVAAAPASSPELPRGVAAVAGLFSEDGGTPELAVRAVQVLKGASEHSQCHAAIVERGAGPLVDLLMGHHAHIADSSINSRRLVYDVLEIVRNVSSDSKHAHAIVDAGGIFAIANLTETGGPPVLAGEREEDLDVAALATEILGILARHPECRLPILECGSASSSMLHLIAKTVQPNTGQGPLELPPTVIAAIGTLEILMSNVKHPSISVAVSRNADVGPALASLLTHGDKRLREKAARLLYFAAAVSDDGGAFWQALQHSGHTAAIVAILATASLGIKAGHGPQAPPGKLAEQMHVATGACGSLTALCHRSHSKAVEVVNAGGLNYLVQLSSIQNMRAAALCLGTIIFQTDVHRSTLSDGDGAACDVLLQACVRMLANNSGSSHEKSQVVGETSDAVAILDVAVGIVASLCGESDQLAARVSERLSACDSRKSAVQHLSAMVEDLKSSPLSSTDETPPLSKTTSNALIVLSSLLMMNGSTGGSNKLQLQPEEVQLVSHISPHLVDLLHMLPRQENNGGTGNSLNVSAPLMRRRLRLCVEGLASVPQCAEAMFRHTRTVPALVALLKQTGTDKDSDSASNDVEETLTALVTLHHLNVALPAAVPYAIMEVEEALPSLIALLSSHKSKSSSKTTDHVPTFDLLDENFGSQSDKKEDKIDISSTVSEEEARVRRGVLTLLLDISTAPPASGSQVSLRQRLAKHQGLLTAVSYPLREAAEAAAPVVSEHVDMLFDMQSDMSSSFSVESSPTDMFAADLASSAPPNYDAFSTTSSYDSLPQPPTRDPTPTEASSQDIVTKVVHSDAVLESQALAVRLLGELAAAGEEVRARVLSMSRVFDGAVALLGDTEGEGSAAQDALRSAAARLVRNLTLSLVIGGNNDDYSGQSYADLTNQQISDLHLTLVNIATREMTSGTSQIDAAADCAWGLRTLMAKEEGLKLTKSSACISRILTCLTRCVSDDKTMGLMVLASPLMSIIQSLAQHPDAVSVLVYAGLLRTLGQVLQFALVESESGMMLAVESCLVLSAVAFHPEARTHADMEYVLAQLMSMVATGKDSPSLAFTATHVLGPLADRALAACGRSSMAGSSTSSSITSGGGSTTALKPLKVPGWNSGPASKSPPVMVTPTMVSPVVSARHVPSTVNAPSPVSAPAPVVAAPMRISEPLIPSAASIAEAAALAFTSPRSPTPTTQPSQPPRSKPELKWSESEDEALARRLQAEDEGGQQPSYSNNVSMSQNSNSMSMNNNMNNDNNTMAMDAAMAQRLQEEDGGGFYSQKDEQPPMPLTSLGTNYTPPPPSYGSF